MATKDKRMNRTKIEWADAVWNPVTGCSPISRGCERCYAARMAKRFAGRFGYPKKDPFRITVHIERFHEPFNRINPKMIFVCSMGDLFHASVPLERIIYVFEIMLAADWHTYIILTKRPFRMMKVVKMIRDKYPQYDLDNIWLGVTVEDNSAMVRLLPLLRTSIPVHFVSFEPLLERIKPPEHFDQLSWVICGAETGPRARPMDPKWARELLSQCRDMNIPFFMKQMSRGDPIPKDLMVRQYPKILEKAAT